MDERFVRVGMLLGPASMQRLHESRVAVFGLGGVGSWCAEALARTGVGGLVLVDQDDVARSNINRQLCAKESTLGQPKAEVMARRLLDINPALRCEPVIGRYEAAARESFFSGRYDYIVDAIDLVSNKLDLIQTALSRGIPIVSALGTGNKTDASLLRLCDISSTEGCPLARVVRKELRRRGVTHLTVVYSPEEGLAPSREEKPPPGRRSVPGSLVFVPATAGLLLAQHVVLSLVGTSEDQSQ
jgi:tRNA A37 threonylcarbamoyladenosine dehydratase